MSFLIAGLGNIGEEYEHTRHNIGFKIADELVMANKTSFQLERLAFFAEYRTRGKNVYVIKPTTYMNLSGKAVRYWMNELKIQPNNLLVVLDDLALPFSGSQFPFTVHPELYNFWAEKLAEAGKENLYEIQLTEKDIGKFK